MKIRKSSPHAISLGFAPSLLLLNLLTAPALAQNGADPKPTVPATTPAPQDANQTPPLSIPTAAPIPTGPPPTGLQAPLPTPIGTMPKADKPLRASPQLNQLTGRVPPQPLNINDAVAIALINNRDLALSTAALLRAQGRLSETRAAFNPTLVGGFTYTRLNQGQSVNLGSGSTTGGTTNGGTTTTSQNINIVNADQPVFNASVALPLDIAGLLRTAERQAQFLEVAQKIDINRTRNQIVLDTKSAFYNVLRAQALVVVRQDTLRNSQDRLLDAQRKFAAGTVARFDVIRALTDVQNARQDLIVAQTNVDSALGNLNSNLGLNIDTPLSITSQDAVADPPGVAPASTTIDSGAAVPPGNNAPANPVPGNPADPNVPPATGATGTTRAPVVVAPSNVLGPEYRAVVQEAIANRPEILESDAQIAAARKGIQLARRSQLPTLSLSLGGQYSPNAAGFAPQTTSGSFVAALSFPLYDGGVSGARVTQARADVATAETNRRQAVDSVNLEVRTAYLNLLQSRDRVAVANQALSEAAESYRLARVRYTNGVSTLVEVSDAQNALTQAENNQVNALYDYNNNRASLDKAAGRYAYLGNAAGFPAPPSPKVTGSQ